MPLAAASLEIMLKYIYLDYLDVPKFQTIKLFIQPITQAGHFIYSSWFKRSSF